MKKDVLFPKISRCGFPPNLSFSIALPFPFVKEFFCIFYNFICLFFACFVECNHHRILFLCSTESMRKRLRIDYFKLSPTDHPFSIFWDSNVLIQISIMHKKGRPPSGRPFTPFIFRYASGCIRDSSASRHAAAPCSCQHRRRCPWLPDTSSGR